MHCLVDANLTKHFSFFCSPQHTLLSEFLTHLKRGKDDELMQLKRISDVIQEDLDRVNEMMSTISFKKHKEPKSNNKTEPDQNVPPVAEAAASGSSGSSGGGAAAAVVPDSDDETSAGFNVFRNPNSVFKSTLPQVRKASFVF